MSIYYCLSDFVGNVYSKSLVEYLVILKYVGLNDETSIPLMNASYTRSKIAI